MAVLACVYFFVSINMALKALYSPKSSILTRMYFVIPRLLAFQPQLNSLAIPSNIAHFFFVPTSRCPIVTVEPFVTKRDTALRHHELE